jgi:hypothetical protein
MSRPTVNALGSPPTRAHTNVKDVARADSGSQQGLMCVPPRGVHQKEAPDAQQKREENVRGKVAVSLPSHPTAARY